ncbi:MAG: aminoacyl-tRNA hydrolase [Planctomycetota bacterium]
MHLIIGLGNPGPEYAKTRHNAGFLALDRLAERHGIAITQSKFHSLAGTGIIADQKVLLLKPQTFMNRSGLTVGEAKTFYKTPIEKIVVLVDELALPAGNIRLRAGGSSNGHNGLKDIKRVLATQAYPRLRIGIDDKGRVNQADYVLSPFTDEQAALLDPALNRAADALETWLAHGIDKAMSLHNA